MPAYDYVCEACRNEFEIWASMEEYSKGAIKVCPFCGSEKIQQKLTPFQIATSRGSSQRGGSSCGPAPRSGCCG